MARWAPGAATRKAVDNIQADQLQRLSAHLRPGLTLRIERLRPHWAAGWIEDYPLERNDSMGAVYGYLRDEHGGQLFRVQVLGAGDTMLYEAQIAIAGKPRSNGVEITRQAWEGAQPPQKSQSKPSVESQGQNVGALGLLMDVMRMFMEQQQKSSEATLGSVREMVAQTREQTTALLEAVTERSAERAPQSLATQLAEVVESAKAVERVRKVFGGGSAAGKSDDSDGLDGAMREATRAFMGNALASFMRPSAPAQPQRARLVQRRTPNGKAPFFPEAAASRQKN